MGRPVLQGLVWLGEPQPPPAGGRGGQMLKRHLDNPLTYLKHHLTNAVTEG